MSSKRLAIAWALCASVAAPIASAGLPVQPDPAVEARFDSLLRASKVALWDGRLLRARELVEEAATVAPNDPRVGLFRYRIMRENYPDDVHEEERAAALAPPLLDELDTVIGICDSMLAVDGESAAAYLYRGWAYLMKAQTHVIAREICPAASSSRKGKNDLDRFFERVPEGDPDAKVTLGGFLYFADILPGIVKFLRWVIRAPGGDKERGLTLMREGIAGGGYTSVDGEVVLGVIYYLFEGRPDEAAKIFDRVGDLHPWNPRLVELRGSTALLYPRNTMQAIEIESRVIEGWNTRVRGWDDLFVYRLRWSRARLLHQAGLYDRALDELKVIYDAAPPHPFWVTPRSLLSAISLLVNLGRTDEAQVLCERLTGEEAYEAFHDAGRDLCSRRPAARDVAVFEELGTVRHALYSGRTEEARTLLDGVVTRHGSDARIRFFLAEIERLEGRYEEAAAAYDDVLDQASGEGFDSLSMVSLLRMGEMSIERADYRAARSAYEEAGKLEPRASMLGNMIRGRLRFIEEQKN